MATLNWTLGGYCSNGNNNVMSANDQASGAATTSGAAGAVSGFVPQTGQVAEMTASADMWVRFGGRTAAVGTGFFLPAGTTKWVEIGSDMNGAVSAIDV